MRFTFIFIFTLQPKKASPTPWTRGIWARTPFGNKMRHSDGCFYRPRRRPRRSSSSWVGGGSILSKAHARLRGFPMPIQHLVLWLFVRLCPKHFETCKQMAKTSKVGRNERMSHQHDLRSRFPSHATCKLFEELSTDDSIVYQCTFPIPVPSRSFCPKCCWLWRILKMMSWLRSSVTNGDQQQRWPLIWS